MSLEKIYIFQYSKIAALAADMIDVRMKNQIGFFKKSEQ